MRVPLRISLTATVLAAAAVDVAVSSEALVDGQHRPVFWVHLHNCAGTLGAPAHQYGHPSNSPRIAARTPRRSSPHAASHATLNPSPRSSPTHPQARP